MLHFSSESETNHEPDMDSQSKDERDTSAPLGWNYMSKTSAQSSAGEILRPTSLEIIALQVMMDMRLLSQSAVDNHIIIRPHASIDYSRVAGRY